MGLLKPRTATVTIYQGDDMARLAELYRAAEVAGRLAEEASKRPRRGGDPIPSAEAEQAAYDAFVDEAAERALDVTLTAIGSRRFRDLLAEHPPRMEKVDGKDQVVEDDAEYAVNTATLPKALLTYRDKRNPAVRTITDPDLSEDDLLEFLDDDCSDGDFEKLWETAFWLNRGEGIDARLGKILDGHPDLALDLDAAASQGLAAVWDDLPGHTRAWWRARHLRERATHATCGHPREVCANPDLPWFPQLSVCFVTMETQAAQARFDRLHEKAPWHDGTFESWAEKPSDAHPYHVSHGTTVWVSDTDLGLGGDFLKRGDGPQDEPSDDQPT